MEMNQTSRSDFQGDKHINDAKGGGHGGEEIASHNCLGVIFQESGPALVSRSARPGQLLAVLCDGARREPNLQLQQQLIGNALLSPGWISAPKRRIESLTSAVTGGLPTGLDFQRQKRRNAARCQPIKVAGLTITNALRQSNQRASFENTNLSPGVVGSAFFSRSRNRANCLRKNRFSAARAKRRRPILAKKLKQSLMIVRRFRTSLESRLKTLNIFAIVSRLTHSFRVLIGLLRRTPKSQSTCRIPSD